MKIKLRFSSLACFHTMFCKTANLEERLGKYFLIKTKSQPDLILEIKDSRNESNMPVVLGLLNDETKAADHQLWFTDKSSFTIRSKLNSFCIDLNGA